MSLAIDRLLIGDNSFNGVDHLSQERSREKANTLNVERISNVIKIALDSGAQGLSLSVTPNMYEVLRHLKDEEYDKEFGMYPILPDASSNVRIASEKGMVGMMTDLFGKMDFGTKAKSLIQGGLGALTMDPTRIMKTYLNAQVSIFMGASPKNAKLKAVFLHEIISDLIVSFQMKDLFREYVEFASDSLDTMPGFVTRNFARFADFVATTDVPMKDLMVMTPFNKVGFQMNPSRESCEESLSKIPDSKVIAMSILASGYLKLEDSVQYLHGLPKPVSCVVGVSTELHAKETFSFLQSHLS